MTLPPAEPAPVPVPLYTAEHAADPGRSYELLRRQGPVGVAEVSENLMVYVVTDYRAALDLFSDTDGIWTKDSSGWIDQVPLDSPIRPMVDPRPNSVFFADDEEHAHRRRVITDSLSLLDPHEVRELTFRHADTLLQRFAHMGKADLIDQYARRMPVMILNALFGMGDEHAPALDAALTALLSTDTLAKAEGERALAAYLGTLYATKAARRGHDLTSWFIDHPNGLSPEEVIEQVAGTQGAAYATLTGLIGNTLERMLSDDRYFGTLTTGSLPIQHAIDDALWDNPPLALYSLHFPREDVDFYGTYIPAGAPVMVHYAAANSSRPSCLPADGHRSGNKAHLAFAAGPHACPARPTALLVAGAAIERLISYLPDIELAVPRDELTYHPGAMYRSLVSLPCRFTRLDPDSEGATPWDRALAGQPPVNA